MLSAAETFIVDTLKASAVARYCRRVDVMPDLSESAVRDAVGRPPALYVALRSYKPEGEVAEVVWSVWCVAQSYRGAAEGRVGDGAALGLMDLAEGAMAALLEAGGVVVQSFASDRGEYVKPFGVYTGEITCSARIDLPQSFDLAARLARFETFHADYDLAPATPEAHAAWLAEPPDFSTAAPDAADTVHLEQ